MLSVVFLAFSEAPAGASTSVDIGSQFIGTTAAACPGSDQTTWLFVANQLDPGTPSGSLTATFTPSFSATVAGVPDGNGSNQHFLVTTPGGETLDSATATFTTQSGTPKLVLSGTCETSPPTTTTTTTTVAPTTTTSTTSTTVAPTTTMAPTTTTTAAPVGVLGTQLQVSPTTTTTVPTQVLGEQITQGTLPKTGSDHAGLLAALAGLLLMLGTGLVLVARRRRVATH